VNYYGNSNMSASEVVHRF